MLDDINLNEREALLATLDRHPQIDIRIFNPIPSRGFTKWFNFMGDFSRLNHRMHNKSFTDDGAMSNLSWVQARFVFDRPVPIDASNTNKPKMTATTLAT